MRSGFIPPICVICRRVLSAVLGPGYTAEKSIVEKVSVVLSLKFAGEAVFSRLLSLVQRGKPRTHSW